MNINSAIINLSNLRERIEAGADGRYRIEGLITNREIEALEFFISYASVEIDFSSRADSVGAVHEGQASVLNNDRLTHESIVDTDLEDHVSLDLTSIELPESDLPCRVCLDFGTAMLPDASTAVYVTG